MKVTKSLEVVYLYATIVPTQKGDAMMYLAFDEYSKYAFEAVISDVHQTDLELISGIEAIVYNVFKDYNSLRHAHRTVIITNLPEETTPVIENSHNHIYKVISDVEKTEKVAHPFLDSMFSR